MKLTIEIHDAWLGRPEDLRKILATLAGLECPPTGGAGPRPAHDPREDLEEPFDPEDRPRGRNGNGRYPGDDDRNQASHDDHQGAEEDPPTDGRQLLGWAAKQVPDAKGRVISVGKKRGYPSRTLDWTPQQVAAAYRTARCWPVRHGDPHRRRGLPDHPRPDAPEPGGQGQAPSLRPGQPRRRPVGVPRPAPPRPAAPGRAAGRYLRELAVPGVRREHRAGSGDRGRGAGHVAGGDGPGAEVK